jgi:wobble nucleotide-excising tRNase
MIERINLLKNVGKFAYDAPSKKGVSFSRLSLIYAENGSGKTTLAEIFRSLSNNNPALIRDRKRLGSDEQPHVVLDLADGQKIFQNDAWRTSSSHIAIFDDAFVEDNVYSGLEVEAGHRQGLYNLILGAQGVTLNGNFQKQVKRIEEHNADLRNLANQIPKTVRGPYEIDAFCDLKAQHHLTAAHSADAILKAQVFEAFTVPEFNIEDLDGVLGKDLADIEAGATERVKAHIERLGEGGEDWVSDGVQRIEPVSADIDGEVCPLCAQDLSGSELIRHYRAYFSQDYEQLKATVLQMDEKIKDAHGGDTIATFERDIGAAIQAREFWKDFTELPEIHIDTAAIATQRIAARDAVLKQLSEKAAAPLERMALTAETRQAIHDYQRCIPEVSGLYQKLKDANKQLNNVKTQTQKDDLAKLNETLAKLTAHKARFDPSIAQHCGAYLAEKAAKAQTEVQRDQARTALDQYRDEIFPAYQTSINSYLRRFNDSFSLNTLNSTDKGSRSSASYSFLINKKKVDLTPKKDAHEKPYFRNTLSAGDRRTLALAFFFASLKEEPDLKNKIVVLDDPMTSLDEHRNQSTQEIIHEIAQRVKQVIVLSHSKPFLLGLWAKADKRSSTTLRINRLDIEKLGNASEIIPWDIQNDRKSDHDKHHELIREYLQRADPTKQYAVASALRPTLEGFLRVAYPEHFSHGTVIGKFLKKCNKQLSEGNPILSENDIIELCSLLNYANKFHHDQGSNFQSVATNDQELTDFAKRTLIFASKGY